MMNRQMESFKMWLDFVPKQKKLMKSWLTVITMQVIETG